MIEHDIDQSINIKLWCVKIETALKHSDNLNQFINNKGKLDFGDPEALKVYNQAVALSLADLQIEVPEDNLIPAVCLRHAYLKVLSDNYLPKKAKILEIGLGASAIISMLAAKLYDFHVIATEINEKSIDSAILNIERNKLSHNIEIIRSTGGIVKDVIQPDTSFDGLVCYPPTYTDKIQDTNKLKKRRGFKGVETEMIGGGVDGFDFTRKMLLEATSAQYNIEVITVLCLFLSHVDPSIELLQSMDRKTKLIELIAGTRKRYIVLGIK